MIKIRQCAGIQKVKNNTKPGRGHDQESACQDGMTMVVSMSYLNQYILSWLLKLEMTCWDLTLSRMLTPVNWSGCQSAFWDGLRKPISTSETARPD